MADWIAELIRDRDRAPQPQRANVMLAAGKAKKKKGKKKGKKGKKKGKKGNKTAACARKAISTARKRVNKAKKAAKKGIRRCVKVHMRGKKGGHEAATSRLNNELASVIGKIMKASGEYNEPPQKIPYPLPPPGYVYE